MDCKPGFFGTSCNSPCPSGFFGKHCGGVCFPNCSEDKCHRIYGCEKPNEHIQGSYLTSIATISQSINTSSSEKNEDSSDRNALNATYMLHGLIGILCLLLIVMLIRLCKNSKFENVNVDDIQNECHFQKQPENRHSYDTIPESVAIVQTYGPLESVYDEIDDKIHVHNSISMKTLSDIYEKPGVSTGNPSRTLGTSDLLVPMNDFQREQNEKYSSLMSANMSESIDLEMNCFDKNGYTHAI